MTVPTPAQSKHALGNANHVTALRTALRKELSSLPPDQARAVLADAIDQSPDWLATKDVCVLLTQLPHVGPGAAERWIRVAGIRVRRELGSLTPRQRGVLVDLIRKTRSL